MKKIALFLSLSSGMFWACNDFKVTTTDDGDRIQYHVNEDGDAPQVGDMMVLDMKIQDENDTTYRNSFEDGTPIEINVMSGAGKGSFESALFHLSKGDSATVFVKVDSIFTKMQQPLPPGVTSGSDLRFTVAVRDVMNPEQFKASIEKKRSEEGKTIEEYVAKELAGAVQLDSSGIYYKTITAGSGPSPSRGDSVEVNYLGKLFNGQVFDQTQPGSAPFAFPVGMGFVIQGWDKMVMNMKEGEKITCVIPSKLAYGDRGAGGRIPPFAPLVFDMELVDIKK